MRKIPPEVLTDQSPLIRNESINKIRPVIPANISYLVHKLFFQDEIIKKGEAKRYQVRPHSLRKYFRTQLGAISTIPTDCIEYMKGHTVSTYNDIRMKGIKIPPQPIPLKRAKRQTKGQDNKTRKSKDAHRIPRSEPRRDPFQRSLDDTP